MNPIIFALRHPFTIVVGIIAVVLGAGLALGRMPIDIFPDLNTPVIYVAQPYGGMDPQQMEGFLTNYYEYHFLYITGIDHVESRNIQSMALMKLFFHPGTNMAQAMAETVSYVNRSRSFMPPNTVPPFIMRFDAGSVPVGYLVFESKTKTIGQIQDEALFRVRPMFARLPGVSAPPPFGGNQRTIVIRADPERLRAYHMSPDEVVAALVKGNEISPSGTVPIGDKARMVPVNSVVEDIKDLGNIVIRPGQSPAIFMRDISTIEDTQDIPTGYGLVNGRRSVYILVTKRADASTLAVVEEVKANLPKMQAVLPDDIRVNFEFDQSPYVTRAMMGVGTEALLGAFLTGLMVWLFLGDWRSVLVVVLNIPLALLGALVALGLTGQTVNLMTLGGLALAVGILVDEATVEVENIHVQMGHTPSIARAVRLGNAQTAVPRLLAMLCILAVFIPSFFMQGAAKALFVPLSLAVGFSMVASYLLSSTFVPVVSTWLLRHYHPKAHAARRRLSFAGLQDAYAWTLQRTLRARWLLLGGYFLVPALLAGWWYLGHAGLGTEIFPTVDSGQFQLRLRAPAGTLLEHTEALAKDVLAEIARQAEGDDKIAISVSLVGTASYNYPINAIYLWTSGPHEAVLRVALKRESGIRVEEFKKRLRAKLKTMVRNQPPLMKDIQLSFEAGDIVAEVMSFGAPTPVEVAVNGPKMADNRLYAEKLRHELDEIPSLCDLHYEQTLEYPTLNVKVDRELAGLSGLTTSDVARSLVAATSSSRFLTPNYWRDPKSGVGYQVQVEIPAARMNSANQVEQIPIKSDEQGQLLLQDVAQVKNGTMPGQIDRFNTQRMLSLAANAVDEDLGRVAQHLEQAVLAVNRSLWVAQQGASGQPEWKNAISGEILQQAQQPTVPPRGVIPEIRGQVVPMRQMFGGLAGGPVLQGLTGGLLLAVVVILLLLTAYFQSVRLALVVLSATPAVLAGVVLALLATRTTLNIQSFMGAIMAVGVAVANAILLATFAEHNRREGRAADAAAVEGARHRLRPILMTSCAMIAGMVPLALGLGEGGEQTAPLGRAVIGGLAVATFGTLFVLPTVFAVVQGRSRTRSASLDPDDPQSAYFDRFQDRPAALGNGPVQSTGPTPVPEPHAR